MKSIPLSFPAPSVSIRAAGLSRYNRFGDHLGQPSSAPTGRGVTDLSPFRTAKNVSDGLIGDRVARLASATTILLYPQPEFSLAIETMSASRWSGIPGRPGERRYLDPSNLRGNHPAVPGENRIGFGDAAQSRPKATPMENCGSSCALGCLSRSTSVVYSLGAHTAFLTKWA
jgi:hypothetical protein